MKTFLCATALVAMIAHAPNVIAAEADAPVCVPFADFKAEMDKQKANYIIVDVPSALGVRSNVFLAVIYAFNGTSIVTGFVDINGCVTPPIDLGPAKLDVLG